MPVLRELNERVISIEEVKEAVNEMKSGKAPGVDGYAVECLKKIGVARGIVSETVERKFCFGGSTYALAW